MRYERQRGGGAGKCKWLRRRQQWRRRWRLRRRWRRLRWRRRSSVGGTAGGRVCAQLWVAAVRLPEATATLAEPETGGGGGGGCLATEAAAATAAAATEARLVEAVGRAERSASSAPFEAAASWGWRHMATTAATTAAAATAAAAEGRRQRQRRQMLVQWPVSMEPSEVLREEL